ncbi:MAG: ARMT1-like domain-containing protein, partial [Desulfobacula sp.]|uniref:ARMT1-like domain-containing protein n=1 Tax=Desulfobacula sp. TaxID=2593537 RepID=UPI0025BEE867
MLIQPDCIPCILTMSNAAIKRLSLDGTIARELFSNILTIPGLRGLEWNQPSPDIIEVVMKKISAAVNDPDPFHNEKINLNNRVLKIYPFLKKLVEESSDPLNTAAKISILGNSIDFMMPEGTATIKDFIIKKLETSLSKDEFTTFQNQLSKTKHLLYFGDNCGEIVLDKLFIKIIKKQYD